jgi:hypothetical protein
MPFTPFHMGPGLLVKSLAGRRFSLVVFGTSQVAIDIEPLVHILRGDSVLHGFTHTLLGATLVGAAAAIPGRPLANWVLKVVRGEITDAWELRWLGSTLSWPVAVMSALIGTWSHLVLDGVMHRDMHPFSPLTESNPLLGTVGLPTLHWFCVVSGFAGIGVLVTLKAVALRRKRTA